jgi:hypothetical protein
MSPQYNKVPQNIFYFALHTMYPNVKHSEAKKCSVFGGTLLYPSISLLENERDIMPTPQ